MTGRGDATGQFPAEERQRTLTDEQLTRSSRWTRRMILGKPVNFQSEQVRKEVWEGALQEVERGWMSGPLEEEEVRQWLGPLFVVSKRFGLVQSDKIRSIDDMSESLVNAAYESTYRLDLPGVDGIAVMARTFVEAVDNDRRVRFTLSDGEELCGWLHPSRDVASGRRLVGRTVPLACGSQWTSVLAVENPDTVKKLFVPHVLPFGASSSEYSFNRLSKALHTIGERIFGLVWTCYVDDFPQLDLARNGSDAQVVAERCLIWWDGLFHKKSPRGNLWVSPSMPWVWLSTSPGLRWVRSSSRTRSRGLNRFLRSWLRLRSLTFCPRPQQVLSEVDYTVCWIPHIWQNFVCQCEGAAEEGRW